MSLKTYELMVGCSIFLIGGGCHNCKTVQEPSAMVYPSPEFAPLTSTELDMDNMSKIRSPERLKAYPVGRYVDPNSGDVMHEGHVIYRKEAPAAWNKNPHAPTAVPLGPCIAISHPERQVEPLSVEYETKIMQQNQLMKSLIDQNEALLELVNQLRQEINAMKEEDNKMDSEQEEK